MKLLVEQEHIRGVAERMKILLFNDNPVVRKLVALSAQKTKDELSVVWSLDEISESDYDLLIIDDAMYSDELFLSLKEVVTYKNTLLMATRGQPAPLGFDNVIHKPFLPTDLVDMFVQIEKKIALSAEEHVPNSASVPKETEEPIYSINLEETLPDLSIEDDALNLEEIESFDLGDLEDEIDLSGDDLDLEGFDSVQEEAPQTAILDQEEVQEVQNLLDDAESDDWNLEEEIKIGSIDESLDFKEDISDNIGEMNQSPDEMDFAELLEEAKKDELDDEDLELPAFDEKELLDEEEFDFYDEPALESSDDALKLDESLADTLEFDIVDNDIPTVDENLDDESEFEAADDTLMDEEELGDLEAQIEDAMNNLAPETLENELEFGDLDLEVDDSLLEELELPVVEDDEMDLGDGDPFDSLNEKELKRAIGEEVEEENEEAEAEAEELFDNPEETFESIEEEEVSATPVERNDGVNPSHAEGVEALQALLKALSNEEVAKSLKGLNISININFGNDA